MKIVHADIYGFGKWQQTSLDFSKELFVVINGENESGKSTLRQFMLFMLFGMPPKKRTQFLPKTGGKMGGRLTIEIEDIGTFTIERLHDRNKGLATCYLEDGSQQDEAWLQKSLNGIDAHTFSAIFSFDSSTLQQLQQIKKADIGDVLLGIGMTGTEQIYWTEKWLDQQLSQLFKPQGKKPKMNHLIEKMEEKTEQLVKMEKEEESYQQKKQEKVSLQESLTELQKEYEILRKEKLKTEQKYHLFPTIEAFYQVQQKLVDFPGVIDFPEQGLARYQQLKEAIYPLKSELELIETNIKKEKEQLTKLDNVLLTNDVIIKLEEIIAQASAYQETQNKNQFTQKTIKELETQLQQELHTMQVGLTTKAFTNFSFTFATEEIWQDIKEEKELVINAFATIENEQATLKEQENFLMKEKQSAEQNQLDQATINRFQEQIDQKKQVKAEQKLTEKHNNQQQNWNVMKHKKIKGTNRISLISLGITILAGVAGLLQSNLYWYGTCLVGVFFILIHQILVRQSIRSMDALLEAQSQNSPTTVLNEQQFQDAEAILQEQNKIKIQLEKTENALRDIQLEKLKLDEKIHFYKTKNKVLSTKISEQIELFPFLEEVSVNYWPKLYHHLLKAVEKVEKIDELNNQVKTLTNKINDFEYTLQNSYDEHFSGNEQDKSKILELIRKEIEKQRHNREEKLHIEARIEEFLLKKEKIQSKLQPYQDDISKLWEKAKAVEEEDYITKGNMKRKQQDLQKEIIGYRQQLNAFLSAQEWERLSKGELITKAEIEEVLNIVTAKLNQVQEDIKLKQQKIASIEIAMNQLETSTYYVDEKHRYYTVQSELQQYAKQWAIYQLALEKLKDTKKVFQHHYLPKVLERTAYYFMDITNNRYSNVFVTNQDAVLQVEDNKGIRFNVTELSQGTSDQLYISLRIALSEMFQKQVRMPFFVDDAFVHFDINRLEKVLTIFRNVSKDQQIILFTNDTTWNKVKYDEKNTQIIKI